jgi:hypothetical protein
MRRINDAFDVGAVNDGQDIALNIRMEDGSKEWFSIHHTKVGNFVVGIMFASGVATRDRPKTTPSGNPLPEQSSVIDIEGLNASAIPGENFVVLRLVVGEGVNLDFRVPLSVVPAMQEKLQRALVIAQSGTPPSAH